MQENISVLIATIIMIVIIVLFPIYNIATRQDSVAHNMVVRATTSFVDNVRNRGYIKSEDYGKFLNELDKTGNTFDVQMEVHKPIFVNTAEKTGEEEFEEKYLIDYTSTILSDMTNADLTNRENSVIKENVYYLDSGYKFYVRVKNTNTTQAQVLLNKLLRGEAKERIVINYGGLVYTNEWAKGEGAETVGTNISISRPLDYNLKEYKYEHITTIYDEITGREENIYGIAVRLKDYEEHGQEVRFLLTYRNVNQFEDETGKKLTTPEERINHVGKYIKLNNFEGDISLQEGTVKNEGGNYTYQYLITIKNIDYNFANIKYLRASVAVEQGSAYTDAGELGRLQSEEFIITGAILKSGIAAERAGLGIGSYVNYVLDAKESTEYQYSKFFWYKGHFVVGMNHSYAFYDIYNAEASQYFKTNISLRQYRWRYIGNDENNNAVLIADFTTSEAFTFGGNTSDMVNKLNAICKELYSNRFGEARSVNMQDIIRLFKKANIDYNVQTIAQYVKDNNITLNHHPANLEEYLFAGQIRRSDNLYGENDARQIVYNSSFKTNYLIASEAGELNGFNSVITRTTMCT